MMILPRLLCALASGFLAVSNGAVLVEKYGLHNDLILQASASDSISGNILINTYLGEDYESYDIELSTPVRDIVIDDTYFLVVRRFSVVDARVTSCYATLYDPQEQPEGSYFNPWRDDGINIGVSVDAYSNETIDCYGVFLPQVYHGVSSAIAIWEVTSPNLIRYDTTVIPSSTSGGYSVTITNRSLLDACQAYWTSIYGTNIMSFLASNGAYYGAGDVYEQGFADGTAYGEQLGYDKGYQDGVDNSQTAQGGIIALFGAVANVPIQVLNGLGGLAVWHMPIVGIIVSFLLIAVVAGIIRRFI